MLFLFGTPRNRHEAYAFSKGFPKQLRLSQASLYRKVDSLCDLFFLEVVRTGKFVRGNLRATVNYYRLTLKGRLAAYICAYVLLLNAKTPQDVVEKLDIEGSIAFLESMQASDLFLDFLRWHRARGDDLSRVKIDMYNLVLDFFHFMMEKPERISISHIAQGIQKMKEYGFEVPDMEPAEVRRLFLSSKGPLEKLASSLYASVREKRSKSPKESSHK